MKAKTLNLLLILSSLVGYLEWGKGHHSFLFQAEAEVLSKLFSDPMSAIHPFTILPIVGQLILLATLFQKNPSKILTFCGMGGIGLLLVLMFAIGIMGVNVKIIVSTLPFLVISILTIQHHRKKK